MFGPLAAMIVSASLIARRRPSGPSFNERGTISEGRTALKWGVFTGDPRDLWCRRRLRRRSRDTRLTGDNADRRRNGRQPLWLPNRSILRSVFSLRFGGTMRCDSSMCAPMYAVSVCLYTPIVAALAVAYAVFLPGRFRSSSFRRSLLSGCSASTRNSGSLLTTRRRKR